MTESLIRTPADFDAAGCKLLATLAGDIFNAIQLDSFAKGKSVCTTGCVHFDKGGCPAYKQVYRFEIETKVPGILPSAAKRR